MGKAKAGLRAVGLARGREHSRSRGCGGGTSGSTSAAVLPAGVPRGSPGPQKGGTLTSWTRRSSSCTWTRSATTPARTWRSPAGTCSAP